MTTHTKELILKDSDFPLLTQTVINQVGIEKAGNDIPFFRLIQLKTALDALQPTPPNATTVWFDDTILLQSSTIIPATNILTINPTNFTISDATTYRIGDVNNFSTLDLFADSLNAGTSYATLGSESLNFNFGSTCSFQSGSTFQVNIPNIDLNSSNNITQLGDVFNSSNRTKIVVDDNLQTISVISNNGTTQIGDIDNLGNQTKLVITDTNRCINQYGGKMCKTEEINVTIGTHLEPNAHFFTTVNTNVRLYDVSFYLNPLTPNGDGWYCYLFNYDAAIQITSDDNKGFVGHGSGPSGAGNPYNIKKWTTQRITLVWVQSIGDYVWSVSDF